MPRPPATQFSSLTHLIQQTAEKRHLVAVNVGMSFPNHVGIRFPNRVGIRFPRPVQVSNPNTA